MTDDTKRQKTLRSFLENVNLMEWKKSGTLKNYPGSSPSLRPHEETLELEIPLHTPPASPTKMRLLKMSKLFGMQSKKFDPKTYVEEKEISNDSSSSCRRQIQSKKNVVRWREVTNPDGTVTRESNARFVRWSDGSLQLIIGKEALDVREEEVQGIQQLFLPHERSKKQGILQFQGRLLQKLIVPSKSHPSSTPSKRCTKMLDPDWFIGDTKRYFQLLKTAKQKKVRLTKCSNRSSEGNAMMKHTKKKTN